MAGMIKKEDVEKVRAAADLYDIVSASVTLKPSGTGTYVGLCPFHDEKTPSFSVRPSLGVWHCFGCGLGGDVFGYVEQQENIDFREAVEVLADRYHIELHYESGSGRNEHTGSKRARLLEANEEAQRFFVSQIMSKEALAARKLLGGRNFSQADCERFGCGYAPQGWDNLVRHLASKGFTQQEMLDAGLARRGQRGVYDYFRGRVTWPIRDSTGRTLGFGARKLYEDDAIAAKYINTPDTQLYRKTQVLYGIDLAKAAIVKKRQVVIVEGYTDVMACHLAGVDTAIATCGTAFGAEHAKIVRRLIADDSLGAIQLIGPLKVEGQALSSRIVFTFDGDAAGQKAALHAFGLDSAFLSQTFVAVADDNLDPCDLRIERGNEAVRSLIERAKPLYDFVIDAAIGRFDTTFTTGQMGAVKAVAPLIAQIRDRSLHDLYTRKAARRVGVDLDVLQREVANERRRLNVRDEDAYASKRRYGAAGVLPDRRRRVHLRTAVHGHADPGAAGDRPRLVRAADAVELHDAGVPLPVPGHRRRRRAAERRHAAGAVDAQPDQGRRPAAGTGNQRIGGDAAAVARSGTRRRRGGRARAGRRCRRWQGGRGAVASGDPGGAAVRLRTAGASAGYGVHAAYRRGQAQDGHAAGWRGEDRSPGPDYADGDRPQGPAGPGLRQQRRLTARRRRAPASRSRCIRVRKQKLGCRGVGDGWRR